MLRFYDGEGFGLIIGWQVSFVEVMGFMMMWFPSDWKDGFFTWEWLRLGFIWCVVEIVGLEL